MNDKIFELQQELIELQNSMKQAIIAEQDTGKHISIIEIYAKKEREINEKLQIEINGGEIPKNEPKKKNKK